MKTIKVNCDICSTDKQIKDNIALQVIFTNNASANTGMKFPRLSTSQLDLCETCLNRRLKGDSVFARYTKGKIYYFFEEICDHDWICIFEPSGSHNGASTYECEKCRKIERR
jgi:hypothetical protein